MINWLLLCEAFSGSFLESMVEIIYTMVCSSSRSNAKGMIAFILA